MTNDLATTNETEMVETPRVSFMDKVKDFAKGAAASGLPLATALTAVGLIAPAAAISMGLGVSAAAVAFVPLGLGIFYFAKKEIPFSIAEKPKSKTAYAAGALTVPYIALNALLQFSPQLTAHHDDQYLNKVTSSVNTVQTDLGETFSDTAEKATPADAPETRRIAAPSFFASPDQ